MPVCVDEDVLLGVPSMCFKPSVLMKPIMSGQEQDLHGVAHVFAKAPWLLSISR